MKVLTVTDVSDETVAELARRAAARGVSVEDEARRVLEKTVPMSEAESFKAHLLSEEYLVDDLPIPPREKWPERDLDF